MQSEEQIREKIQTLIEKQIAVREMLESLQVNEVLITLVEEGFRNQIAALKAILIEES